MNKRAESSPCAVTLLRAAALAVAAVILSACSLGHLPTNIEVEAPLSTSVAQAESKLEAMRSERAATEARFGAAEQVCYARFFTNTCLDEAKEKRRLALAQVRAVELEAEYYVRKAKADQRDAELALAAKEFAASEARVLAAASAAPSPEAGEARPRGAKAPAAAGQVNSPKPPKPPKGPKAPKSAAELEADAAKRAASVIAYDKRQAVLLERQRRVEEKKAKRAAKDAARKAAKEGANK